jgi:hypothetical protein
VSPIGEVHDVSDADLYTFCKTRRLHYENMINHIQTATSDQKNGGWRLIERLCAIGHVNRPHEHVLALGTPTSFHQDCMASNDGRTVLKDPKNLGKLIKGSYKGGGKPWHSWECRTLSTAEKRRALASLIVLASPSAAAGSAQQVSVSALL